MCFWPYKGPQYLCKESNHKNPEPGTASQAYTQGLLSRAFLKTPGCCFHTVNHIPQLSSPGVRLKPATNEEAPEGQTNILMLFNCDGSGLSILMYSENVLPIKTTLSRLRISLTLEMLLLFGGRSGVL